MAATQPATSSFMFTDSSVVLLVRQALLKRTATPARRRLLRSMFRSRKYPRSRNASVGLSILSSTLSSLLYGWMTQLGGYEQEARKKLECLEPPDGFLRQDFSRKL